MGKISISDLDNKLIQKTDRSGFIENESFSELRHFAQDVLNWMAKKRLEERETKRVKEKSEDQIKVESTKKDFENKLKDVPSPHKAILTDSFSNYDKTKDKFISNLKKEVQLYRTLSTVGIAAAVFAHESGNNPLKIVSQSIGTINRRLIKFAEKFYDEHFKEPITRIRDSVKSLSVLSKVSLSLVEYEKRRSGRIDIHETIEKIVGLYKPFSINREVTIDFDFDSGNPYMRGSVAALESIITNLLNNSYNAFEQASISERKIIIRSRILDNQTVEVRVLDNGPGIREISKKDIWLPGETTKKNGTGLGLTIVRDTVTDLGGKVDAVEKSELGGAEIIITLKILGS
jgi:C4-dicarboxylate-specific signal transduction histidine kinase